MIPHGCTIFSTNFLLHSYAGRVLPLRSHFQDKIASSTISFPKFKVILQSNVLFLLAVNGIVIVLLLQAWSSPYVDDLTIFSSGLSIPVLYLLLLTAISFISSLATNLYLQILPHPFLSHSTLIWCSTPILSLWEGIGMELYFSLQTLLVRPYLHHKEKACHSLLLLQTLSHKSWGWGSDHKTVLHLHITHPLLILDATSVLPLPPFYLP